MRATLEGPAADRCDRSGDAAPDEPAAGGRANERARLLFAAAILLSAFLLFQVQLVLGKQLLPLFGGAPAVWTACLLVFQMLLLAGYAYAHGIAVRLTLRMQVLVQVTLLGASVALLAFNGLRWTTPITPAESAGSLNAADPTWTIVRLLLSAVGLPFLVLATTSPLLQHWLARTAPRRSPYRLYALSNLGSFLGLLSYPFLVEPNVRLRVQAWVWAACYGLFVAVYCACARSAAVSVVATPAPAGRVVAAGEHRDSRGWRFRVLWTGLAACGSVLLLATTNLICQEIAVIPFLWVLPLSLYLFSFVACFESDRWYRREAFHPLLAVTVGLVIVVSLPNATHSFVAQLAAYCAVLFAGCMVCHGEAAQTRPGTESLTSFYLCIATGGALGGVFVGVIAPRVFPNYWEFPLGVLACIAVSLVVAARDPSSWWHMGRASQAMLVTAGIVLLAPVVLGSIWRAAANVPRWIPTGLATLLILGATTHYFRERRRGKAIPAPALMRGAARAALALLTAGLVIPQKAEFYHVTAHSRDFYGVLSVFEDEGADYLALRHGKTLHGFQYQDRQRSHLATGYYGPHSGANIVIRNWPKRPMRVGLVGMGVGTLAAAGQGGDVFRFYEINPAVYRWSSGEHPYFSFLRDSAAKVEVVFGDARVSLAAEAARGESGNFDVLVLDAFSSDAIPMHLLAREAFGLYEKHLRGRDSVIAVHISNQTLNLRPVLAGIAREFEFHARRVYPLLPTDAFSQSDWVLLSKDPASLSSDALVKESESFPGEVRRILWSDDYCDLFHVLRWRD